MKDTFDGIFKILVVLMLGYFLFLLNKISDKAEPSNEVGRYHFSNDGNYILDTKTGHVYELYTGNVPK